MQQAFEKKIYGQRRQVETVFSMIKRNQGEALRSKTYWAQNREMRLKVLTHNITVILLVKELFYRACPVLFPVMSIFPDSVVRNRVNPCQSASLRFTIRSTALRTDFAFRFGPSSVFCPPSFVAVHRSPCSQ